MNKDGYAMRFEIEDADALKDCVQQVLLHISETGEEQSFRVRLVLNELLRLALDPCLGQESIRMLIRYQLDNVRIEINDAVPYAGQFIRYWDRTPVCGSAFEENGSRLSLVRAISDELTFNVKDGRLTAVVCTA